MNIAVPFVEGDYISTIDQSLICRIHVHTPITADACNRLRRLILSRPVTNRVYLLEFRGLASPSAAILALAGCTSAHRRLISCIFIECNFTDGDVRSLFAGDVYAERIALIRCGISPVGMSIIGDSMARNTFVTDLAIDDCTLDPHSVATLAAGIPCAPSLRYLSVRYSATEIDADTAWGALRDAWAQRQNRGRSRLVLSRRRSIDLGIPEEHTLPEEE